MKFQKTGLTGKYNVVVNGDVVGQVWKTYRYGYDFWRNSVDGKKIFTTRREASESLMRG